MTEEPPAQTPPPFRTELETREQDDSLSIFASVRTRLFGIAHAHTRRETYIGTWLPEPVDTSCDPGIGAEFSCRAMAYP